MILDDMLNDFQATENVCDIPHDFQATEKCVTSYGFIVRMRQATCIEMQMIGTVWCRTIKQAKASFRNFFFFDKLI